MSSIVTAHYHYKRPPGWCLRLMVSGLCVMIGLAVISPALGAEDRFDGVYTGKRALTKGSNQACLTGDNVSVTINGEALTFTNSRLHNYSIGFEPHPDGSFNEISAGDEGAFVTIQGRIVGDGIEADVADDVCEYHWHLTRTRPPRYQRPPRKRAKTRGRRLGPTFVRLAGIRCHRGET
jgi:hypothetical protein